MLGFGGGLHAGGEDLLELVGAAFEEELDVADGLFVDLGCGEAFDAGAEAALDVVLQAGAGMVAGEIDFAAWDRLAGLVHGENGGIDLPGGIRASANERVVRIGMRS